MAWQGLAIAGGKKLIEDTAKAGIQASSKKKKGKGIAQIIGQILAPGIGGPIAKAVGNLSSKNKIEKGGAIGSLALETLGSGLSVAKDIVTDPIIKKKLAEAKAKRLANKKTKIDKLVDDTQDRLSPEADKRRIKIEELMKNGITPMNEPEKILKKVRN